ncbi:MAG: uroporphyrinogen-III synthase [Geminicoccaceae bacterium]|nr:uroporphyrinogen-III synthase [Geminicoccaceae bacterium]
MRVLVTRPEPQASATAAELRRRGHEPLPAPLTRVETVAPPAGVAEDADAFLVTSPRAAPFLAALPQRPVYAVGAATARACRAAGASVVHTAEGEWRSLADLVVAQNGGTRVRFVHLAGADVRGRLDRALHRAGHDYRRVTVYRAVAVERLGTALLEQLDRRTIDAATFLSPRAASIWCRLITEADRAPAMSPMIAACMSEAVAAELAALPFADIRVARSLAVDAVLDRLDEAAGPELRPSAEHRPARAPPATPRRATPRRAAP